MGGANMVFSEEMLRHGGSTETPLSRSVVESS